MYECLSSYVLSVMMVDTKGVEFCPYMVGGDNVCVLRRMKMVPDVWKLLQIFLEELLNISQDFC